MQTNKKSGLADVNGTRLYYEIRGSGAPVLLISGATGDAGHYDQVTDLLADKFTVVTYDRRGNSRSPRPVGWRSTSIEEQADDAAALLKALDLVPATVFGSSFGAIIALGVAIRHPEVAQGVILHDAAPNVALSNPDAVIKSLQPIIESGMAKSGPAGATEALFRLLAGDSAFEHLDPSLRDRMLRNGEVLFGLEFNPFIAYDPGDGALSGLKIPVEVLTGAESPTFFHEAATWLATRLGEKAQQVPGGHTPSFDRPRELANVLGPLITQMTSTPSVKVSSQTPKFLVDNFGG
jgi:pimeloyl-ACP methyl ester carboxylesterase